MDREAADKPFGRLSALLRGLQKAFVTEIGVDAEGLVLNPKVGDVAEVLGALAELIAASDKVQKQIDALEWSDHAAWQAFERAEAKAAGME
jgi:hypothetical protein